MNTEQRFIEVERGRQRDTVLRLSFYLEADFPQYE